MRTLFFVISLLLVTASAQAQPSATPATQPSAPVTEKSQLDHMWEIVNALSGYFSQDELNLLYTHFRDRLIISFTGIGEPEELPPDLMFRMQILEKRFEREGKQYLEAAIRELEAFIDDEKPAADSAAPAAKK